MVGAVGLGNRSNEFVESGWVEREYFFLDVLIIPVSKVYYLCPYLPFPNIIYELFFEFEIRLQYIKLD